MIGEHDQIQKANDDGEPSGTAGVPMLEVLKKQGLKRYSRCRHALFWWYKARRRRSYPRLWKSNNRRY